MNIIEVGVNGKNVQICLCSGKDTEPDQFIFLDLTAAKNLFVAIEQTVQDIELDRPEKTIFKVPYA